MAKILPRQFPPGKELETELRAAFRRIGVKDQAYIQRIVGKYQGKDVDYPHVLMIVGIPGGPRITRHSHYREVVERGGDLLDYGCGLGEDVRLLIKDGYPIDRITAYDIENGSVELGFDLFRDREELQDMFVVNPDFSFEPESFDAVYSGSTIHSVRPKGAVGTYLGNAYMALRHDGILFGSTLGSDRVRENVERLRKSGRDVPPTLLTEDELRSLLAGAGFTGVEIEVRKHIPYPKDPKYRFWFTAFKN